jgi:hypothetical protein
MKDLKKSIKEKTEEQIQTVIDSGISSNNLDYLYKLVDIHKDIANEEYWEEKEDYMYSNYGRYGREAYGRRARDSRGRYMGHRPEDRIDEMYMNYQAYAEGRDSYGRSGNYSAKEDSMMCLETMLESMVDFVKMLKSEASSQDEMELIHKYVAKLNEM